MRRAAGLALLFALGCGDTSLAPFGQLQSPVSISLHAPTEQLFVASMGGDELRVLDVRNREFLSAPAGIFPLSVPTVRNPSHVAAAERFVFVVSGASSELAFVDTVVPASAVGPRGIEDAAGLPITLPLDLIPSALVSFAAAHPWESSFGLADHALIAGLSDDGDGLLLAARPPVVDGATVLGLPSPESLIELPGVHPAALAMDVSGLPAGEVVGAAGGIDDCRLIAVADGRAEEEGHVPAIHFVRARVSAVDGRLTLEAPAEGDRFEVRVPLQMPDGSIVERPAAIRNVSFAPAPRAEAQLAAVSADPCAPRAGRLIALLDERVCAGSVGSCPDLAVIDLVGPTLSEAMLARNEETGGPALFDIPATPLQVATLAGPINLSGAFTPFPATESGEGRPLDAIPGLAMVASSNGVLYYLQSGLGPWLQGPGPSDRARPDGVFLLDASRLGASVRVPPERLDDRRSPAALPVVELPPGARPRDERWNAGHLAALPGFEQLGSLSQIVDGRLRLDVEVGALRPLADPDPRAADRVVPVSSSGEECEGFPVVAFAGDELTLDMQALNNAPGCLEPGNRLELQPPLDRPLWLSGSVTGFVGRLPLPEEPLLIGADGRVLFRLALIEPPEAGARWQWQLASGFSFFRAASDLVGDLPSSMATFLRSPPSATSTANWRVFVAFSGQNALLEFNPAVPFDPELFR